MININIFSNWSISMAAEKGNLFKSKWVVMGVMDGKNNTKNLKKLHELLFIYYPKVALTCTKNIFSNVY